MERKTVVMVMVRGETLPYQLPFTMYPDNTFWKDQLGYLHIAVSELPDGIMPRKNDRRAPLTYERKGKPK